MGKLVEITLEIDADLKEQAEKVCMENGLTLEEAAILFFEETVRLGKLPFELDEDLKECIKVTSHEETMLLTKTYEKLAAAENEVCEGKTMNACQSLKRQKTRHKL